MFLEMLAYASNDGLLSIFDNKPENIGFRPTSSLCDVAVVLLVRRRCVIALARAAKLCTYMATLFFEGFKISRG